MRLVVVLAIVGRLLRMFAIAFVPPAVLAAVEGDWEVASHFVITLVATLVFGFGMARAVPPKGLSLRRAEALGVVSMTWLVIALFGAIPYMLFGLGFVDSLFESMSGFTTTGATILQDFHAPTDAFFLWRSMTQWFGGLGVIALFVVVLPRLGIAGRQLFFAETSSAPGEAVSPGVRSASSRLWLLYTGLTALLVGLLILTGMQPFDSLCNALTTLSAGGFSPNGGSIGGYANPGAEWVLIVFMLISGMSYPLLYISMFRSPKALLRDGEFLFYFGISLGVGATLALILVLTEGLGSEEALRSGLFQSASLISSTGFASTDYNLWSDGAKVVIVFVMLVGGCAGSAAGGPKAIRHLLVAKHVLRELKRVLHPRAVLSIKYKGTAVSDSIMRAVFTLVVLYMGSTFVIGTLMVLMGQDIVTGFTAAVATVGNVGPAFNAAGPMGNFADFSEPAKLVLTFAMWIGRLEIVTVLALFHLDVIRNIRLRRFS